MTIIHKENGATTVFNTLKIEIDITNNVLPGPIRGTESGREKFRKNPTPERISKPFWLTCVNAKALRTGRFGRPNMR